MPVRDDLGTTQCRNTRPGSPSLSFQEQTTAMDHTHTPRHQTFVSANPTEVVVIALVRDTENCQISDSGWKRVIQDLVDAHLWDELVPPTKQEEPIGNMVKSSQNVILISDGDVGSDHNWGHHSMYKEWPNTDHSDVFRQKFQNYLSSRLCYKEKFRWLAGEMTPNAYRVGLDIAAKFLVFPPDGISHLATKANSIVMQELDRQSNAKESFNIISDYVHPDFIRRIIVYNTNMTFVQDDKASEKC